MTVTISISDSTLSRLSSSSDEFANSLSTIEEILKKFETLIQKRSSPFKDVLNPLHQAVDLNLVELQAHLKSGLDLPLSIVLMGGTNTGKSTTLNLLAGQVISREKVTANATKRPFMYAHEKWRSQLISSQRPWPTPEFSEDSNAPVDTKASLIPILRLHQDQELQDIIFIDCPDLDSTETTNLHTTVDMSRWADRIIFLISPQKYKDRLLVSVLHSLIERRLRVHLIPNLTTEMHHTQEMIEDLIRTLQIDPTQAHLLKIERSIPRFKQEQRSQVIQDLREHMLRPLLAQDQRIERRALLKDRINRLLSALIRFEESIEETEKTILESQHILNEFAQHMALTLSQSCPYSHISKHHVIQQLQSLSCTELLAKMKSVNHTVASQSSSEKSAMITLVVDGLYRLFKLTLGEVSESMISYAFRQATGSHPFKERHEVQTQLLSLTLQNLQVLIAELEAQGQSLNQSEDQPIFRLKQNEGVPKDPTDLPYEVAQVLSSQVIFNRALLQRALMQQMQRGLNELTNQSESLETGIEEQLQQQSKHVTLIGFERTLMLSIKVLCAIIFAFLTFGFDVWDILWAPIGFELGSYFVAWRFVSQSTAHLSSLQETNRQNWLKFVEIHINQYLLKKMGLLHSVSELIDYQKELQHTRACVLEHLK